MRNSRLDAMQILSEIDSAAPNAQHDPQPPWSRTAPITVHFGHCVLASNVAGTSLIFCISSKFGYGRSSSYSLLSRAPSHFFTSSKLVFSWKFSPATQFASFELTSRIQNYLSIHLLKFWLIFERLIQISKFLNCTWNYTRELRGGNRGRKNWEELHCRMKHWFQSKNSWSFIRW